MNLAYLLAITGLLLILCILVSKLSARFGVPSLVFFILIGMVSGSEGLGRIYFNDAYIAQSMGSIALIYILFSGGLDTKWKTVRPVLRGGLSLATIGVILTALTVGLFSVVFLQFSFLQGLLLGSIISSTDAAAVFATLRAKNAKLSTKLRSMVELESGSNDPMAIFLTVTVIQAITNTSSTISSFALSFIIQMLLGSVLGYLSGKLFAKLINRLHFEYQGLYPVFALSGVLLSFGIVSILGGNGFLTVYIMGLVLGNTVLSQKKAIVEFHDGIAWLMQIVMFVVLGLLVFPSQLLPVTYQGLLISAFLIFIARPIGVFISLLFSKYSSKEKMMISWMGLRGAVPIILATFPLLAGVEGAGTIFNIVFFVVLTSALIQGTTMLWIANLTGITSSIKKIVE